MSFNYGNRRALLRQDVVVGSAIGTPTSIGSKSDATGATTRTITNVNVPAGAMIFVLMADSEGVNIPAGTPVTDTAGNTYVAGTQFGNGLSSDNLRTKCFYCLNATAMSNGTITATFATSDAILKTVHAAYVTGILTSGASDVEVNNKNTNTNPTVSTGTLAQAKSVIFGVCSIESGSSVVFTEDTTNGWTQLSQTGVSDKINLAAQVVSSTASKTYAPTLDGSRHWGIDVWAFKGA